MLPGMSQPTFEHYDAAFADEILAAGGRMTGLPEYLGIKTTEVGPGYLVARLPVRPDLLNPFGNLHGGVIAGVVDHLLGAVCYPVIQRGQWAATTEFKVNYLAPVTAGELVGTSTIISLTRRTAVVRIEIVNGDRLAAAAQGTVLIADPKPRPS
jgi:uncharacterized protein (TIGR00369 family)